jgi:tetratricopeptide (TPR) repeat protein
MERDSEGTTAGFSTQSNAFTYRCRGEAKRMLGDFKGALEDLNLADRYQPNNPFILKLRGDTKRMLGDVQGAMNDLTRSFQLDPTDVSTLRCRVLTLIYIEEYEEALKDLNMADQLNPNDSWIIGYRGDVKRLLGDYVGANEEVCRAIELDTNNAYALKIRGEIRRFIGNPAGALVDLNRAAQLQPNDEFILRCRGDVKRKLGDLQGALEDLNVAYKLSPSCFILKCRGDTKHMLGDLEGALEDLNKADQIAPNDAFTLLIRGETKQKLADYEGSLKDLNRAHQLDPFCVRTLRSRGLTKQKLGDLQGALEDFNVAVRLDSTDSVNGVSIPVEGKTVESPDEDNKMTPKIEEKKSQSAVVPGGVLQIPFESLLLREKLGEGGYGEVWLADWREIKVAVKKVKSTMLADLSHEAKTLITLRYKYFVTLNGISEDPKTNNLILVMEYMKHGSLYDLLFKQNVKMARPEIIQIALDSAKGLSYLHSQNPVVIHRDFKSENVLLHSGKKRAKIADFGTAKFLLPSVQAKTVIGTAGLSMPPEMVEEEEYDEKVDVFMFGMVLYEMLTNKRLPQLEEKARLQRIRTNISDEKLAELIVRCCMSDPAERLSIRQVIEALKKIKKEQ